MARYEIRFARDEVTYVGSRENPRAKRQDRFELWRDGQYAGVGVEVAPMASPRDRWLLAKALIARVKARLEDERPEFMAGDDSPETQNFMEIMADA